MLGADAATKWALETALPQRRLADGSIRAVCDGVDRVFTMYTAKQGKILEVAFNFTAARQIEVDSY